MKKQLNSVLLLALGAAMLGTTAAAQQARQFDSRGSAQFELGVFNAAQVQFLPAAGDDRRRCDGDHDRDDRRCWDRDRDGNWYYRGNGYRGNGYYNQNNGWYDRKGNFYPNGANGYYDKHGKWHYSHGQRDHDRDER
jgi:Ni/Co efflux regulator RcnB